MSTVAVVIDRIYREFLTPAAEQPARFLLAANITDVATTLSADTDFLSPEEESLLGPGTIIELDRELVQIGDWDDSLSSLQATDLKRGVLGTTPAAHMSGAYGVIAPDYPRQSVFDAVADAVEGLYPDLYAVATSTALTFSSTAYTEVPAAVAEPLFLWARGSGQTLYDQIDQVNFAEYAPWSTTGKAIWTADVVADGSGYLVYKTKFARPTAESDDLTTLGLVQSWEQIVLIGAIAHLIAGRDLSQAQTEFLTEQMKATNYPVLTPTRIRESLLKYQDYLIQRAQKSLRSTLSTEVIRHAAI